MRTKQILDLCGGSPPEKCNCGITPNKTVTGPFDAKTDALGSAIIYGGCNPDFCTCKGETEEKDGRMDEMIKIMDLCPRNKMSRCLCTDNTITKFPFDLEKFYFECRPKKASIK